ncbi:signal peptidase II [Zoogloea sp.]|jgi:signal peptidase II|uniref:signal peptidase II n=1 Tax=Zoogloea sp. TaxID=49181 RepID=UPI0037D9E17F
MMRRERHFCGRRRWLALAAAIVLADQGIKGWIAAQFPLGASQAVMPFFNLVHLLNDGAAFSLLAGAGGWQRYAFIALASAVSGVLAFRLLQGVATRWEGWGYGLLLGGALGNLTDRVIRGAVVDYLDLHAGGWHWPAFNLADTALCLSVLILLVGMTLGPDQAEIPPVETDNV